VLIDPAIWFLVFTLATKRAQSCLRWLPKFSGSVAP
jgi:hypothetical protein